MDENILLWIQSNMRSDVLTPTFRFITTLGNVGAIWILVTVFFLIFSKTRRTGFGCATALLTSLVFNNLILKNLVARVRPYDVIEGLIALIPHPHDFSFPSGHTAASFAAASVIFVMLPKKYGICALILATLIAFSRLYLGVHYPTDVLFGMLSGTVIGVVSAGVWNNSKPTNLL